MGVILGDNGDEGLSGGRDVSSGGFTEWKMDLGDATKVSFVASDFNLTSLRTKSRLFSISACFVSKTHELYFSLSRSQISVDIFPP